MSKYNAFMDIFTKANPSMIRKLQVQEGQKLWNELKKDPEKLTEKMLELKIRANKIETKSMKAWINYGKKPSKQSSDPISQPSEAFPETIVSQFPNKCYQISISIIILKSTCLVKSFSD